VVVDFASLLCSSSFSVKEEAVAASMIYFIAAEFPKIMFLKTSSVASSPVVAYVLSFMQSSLMSR
jgi:hypothetical protein